ncbi:MAG TPA: hypothetical protein VG815_20255 [Chloroflexota bacterium]|jgi:hypothetical protein|nr:hypothetical protein [Chloroflexota bacterium]
MTGEGRLRWVRRGATALMAAVVLVMALLLSRPQTHKPLWTRGAYPLAPASGPIPTLPPTP